jgi:hypothetical protein
MLSRIANSRRQARLGQPEGASSRSAVGERLGCVYQFAGHPERRVRSARPWGSQVGHRQRIVGAKAVDPRIHFDRGRVIASSERSPHAGNAFGFPGEAALPLGLGFGNGGGPGHGLK